MASSWIVTRATKGDGRNRGRPRYLVRSRTDGRCDALALAQARATSPEPTSVYESRGVVELDWGPADEDDRPHIVDGEIVQAWRA